MRPRVSIEASVCIQIVCDTQIFAEVKHRPASGVRGMLDCDIRSAIDVRSVVYWSIVRHEAAP